MESLVMNLLDQEENSERRRRRKNKKHKRSFPSWLIGLRKVSIFSHWLSVSEGEVELNKGFC